METKTSPTILHEKGDYVPGMEHVLRLTAKHKEPYKIDLAGQQFDVLPGVFSPRYFHDGAFYARVVPNMIRPDERLLEVGPGIGAVSVLAAMQGADVTAVDINEAAVENTKRNAAKYGVSGRVHSHQGDIFSPLSPDERFDTIFWNVPFGYTDKKDLTMLERAIFDPEYATLRRFLTTARDHLTPDGRVLIGFSSTLGHLSALEQFAKEGGLTVSKLPQETLDPEAPKEIKYELYEARATK